MTEFLVVYDYGTGGVWGFASAKSEADVVGAFPEVKVVHEKPAWMSDREEEEIRSASTFLVGRENTYPAWIRALIASRT